VVLLLFSYYILSIKQSDAVSYKPVFMKQVEGSSQSVRPNCLIIDEIDGIAGNEGNVDFLIGFFYFFKTLLLLGCCGSFAQIYFWKLCKSYS